MKPFNLEKAKAGAKVVTRNGLEARILAFDIDDKQPLAVAIRCGCIEALSQHSPDGRCYPDGDDSPHGRDLFMAPVKVVKWTAVYDSSESEVKSREVLCELFDTPEQVMEHNKGSVNHLAIARVEWEE